MSHSIQFDFEKIFDPDDYLHFYGDGLTKDSRRLMIIAKKEV